MRYIKQPGCHYVIYQGGQSHKVVTKLVSKQYKVAARSFTSVGELTVQGFHKVVLDQIQGCHKGSDLVATLPPSCNKLGISIWDILLLQQPKYGSRSW